MLIIARGVQGSRGCGSRHR